MRIAGRVGLVGAGGVNQSFVARMPALLGRLGPVKGSSLRVSRRITNGFRCGTAAARYADLASCGAIWIFVPEESLDRVSADLAREINMRGKRIVVCGVLRGSGSCHALLASGARLATLNCVPQSGEHRFVCEGDAAAVAGLRKDLAADGRKLIELHPGAKSLYLLGVYMGSHMLMPWIAGVARSLRAAGWSRMEATQLVQALGRDVLRGFGTAGERALNAVEADRLRRAVEAGLAEIRATDPLLAGLFAAAPKPARGAGAPVVKVEAC